MALSDIIKADLQTLVTDLGEQVFTWNDEDYECIPSPDSDASVLGEGGFSIEVDLNITVSKDAFSSEIYPASQDKITFNNKTYRIITVRSDASGAFLRLLCNSANRGV